MSTILALALLVQDVKETDKLTFKAYFTVQDISKVSPLELWVSRDNGKSWKTSRDANVKIEWGKGNGRLPVTITVPELGEYGFVAQLRDEVGTETAAPKSGDRAELRVRVVEKKTDAKVEGFPVFLQPEKEDHVPADTTIVIRWQSPEKGFKENTAMLTYRLEGDVEVLIAKNLPLTGSHSWRTPDLAGKLFSLKLTAKTEQDRELGIELRNLLLADSREPKLRWLEPEKSAKWTAGETVQLRWTSLRSDVKEKSATLEYSIEDGPWVTITKGLDPAGFYLWSVPSRATSNLRLRVRASDKAGNELVSDPTAKIVVESSERPNLKHAQDHAQKARVMYAQKDYVGAIEEYEKAIVIWPDYPEALNDLGAAYSAQKQYAKALEYYLRAKAASPSIPTPYVNCASMEIRLGLLEDALRDLHDAMILDIHGNRELCLRAADRLWSLVEAFHVAGQNAKSDEAAKLLLEVPHVDKKYKEWAQEHLDRPKD